jgi:hypothetical protein
MAYAVDSDTRKARDSITNTILDKIAPRNSALEERTLIYAARDGNIRVMQALLKRGVPFETLVSHGDLHPEVMDCVPVIDWDAWYNAVASKKCTAHAMSWIFVRFDVKEH